MKSNPSWRTCLQRAVRARGVSWRLAACLLPAVALSSMTASGCKNETQDPDAEAKLARDLKEAEARLRNNKVADAEKIYARVLETYPDNADAIAGMGLVRWEQKQLDEAEQYLSKAVVTKTEDAALHGTLGALYAQREKHAEAADAFGKAFALDEENGDYGLNYGRALRLTKQYDKAEEVLRKVAEIDPMARFVHTELADVLRETDRLDEALKMYMKAQSTYQSDKMARAGAALVYESKGDIKHAVDEWSAYIRMDCCSEFSNDVAKKKVMELKEPVEDDAGEAEQAG